MNSHIFILYVTTFINIYIKASMHLHKLTNYFLYHFCGFFILKND